MKFKDCVIVKEEITINRDQCKKQTKTGKHPLPQILKPSVFGNIEIF